MTYLAKTPRAPRRTARSGCRIAGPAELAPVVCRFIASAGLAAAVGCSSPPSDATSADMALPATNYAPATINQIDNDPGNGPFGNGQRVVLDRVVAVSKVDKYVNSTNQQCRYQMWVQDAACTTPPCGLVVKAIGPMAPSATATGKDCPSVATSGTALAPVGRGDNLRIRGKLIVEVDSSPPMSVIEHQLFIDSLEILPPTQTITPLVLSDSTQYGLFVTHLGTLWQTYEGMYVALQPASGVLQVSVFSNHGFQTTPGNTDWGDTFDSDYYPTGAVTYPAVGTTFHAIFGVVSTRHGGELQPGRAKDFVP